MHHASDCMCCRNVAGTQCSAKSAFGIPVYYCTRVEGHTGLHQSLGDCRWADTLSDLLDEETG